MTYITGGKDLLTLLFFIFLFLVKFIFYILIILFLATRFQTAKQSIASPSKFIVSVPVHAQYLCRH